MFNVHNTQISIIFKSQLFPKYDIKQASYTVRISGYRDEPYTIQNFRH